MEPPYHGVERSSAGTPHSVSYDKKKGYFLKVRPLRNLHIKGWKEASKAHLVMWVKVGTGLFLKGKSLRHLSITKWKEPTQAPLGTEAMVETGWFF